MRFSLLVTKLLLFGAVLLLPRLASAQTDKEFWFVAPSVFDAGRSFGKPINLRLTSSAAAATVTISLPADPSFTPITVNLGASASTSVDLTPWINQLENTPANTVLNSGLLITSTADITAYYEVVSGFCNCNPEIFSLKGKNALGLEFFISSQFNYDESTNYGGTNGFDIVATKDNTHITITPTQNIIGHSANVPFTITLNKGQTYSAIASSGSAFGHLQGSYVTADNPIAITLKDDLVQVSSCADLVGDQTVPTSVLGTEYIVTRGFLQPFDTIYITAVEDNTSVYVNGNGSPATVLARGQSFPLNLSGQSAYIRADKKIYVYHFTGNGCEAGSAIIPKINCTGSKSVSIVRSNGALFAVLITTKNGNQGSFTVNGAPGLIQSSSFTAVPGTGGAYVTAQIDLSGSAMVGDALTFANATGNFSLGYLNGGTDDGVRYGFFSDFKSSNVQTSSVETCPSTPVQLTAYGGVSYSWSPATGLSNPNIANPTASPSATTDYTVTITSADGCTDQATVHVNVSGLPPSITIAASANNICPGTPVTFTATVANAGTLPAYQWKVNGVNAGNNSSTFNSSTLANGDVVTCVLTGNTSCFPAGGVTSNAVTMAINPSVTPSVSIAASQNNICSGTSVTFTATPTNGGSAPIYQWIVNGTTVGTNSPTYASSTLVNGDAVTCRMVSNAPCAAPTTVTSNVVTMAITPSVTPSVSIMESINNICQGTPVTFTAAPTNGGTAPVYQWKLNGVNVGTNSATYANSTLANGDEVTCVMLSNAPCAAPASVTSNTVTMIVVPSVTPTVTISASSNNICQGTAILFTANAAANGAPVSYQWKINGVNVGSNTSTFSSNTFNNGDAVSCEVTVTATCVATPTATSNVITVTVSTPASPTVSIAANTNNVCKGVAITFTATPTNGGAVPAYQWQVNGLNVAGATAAQFTSSTFADGDKVTCIMTGNAPCTAAGPVTSNTVTLTIIPPVAVSVSIAASQNNICSGTSVTFTATPTNGGNTPTYQWKVNGVNAGANSTTFTSSSFANGDVVTCEIISTTICATPVPATSNAVTMSVSPNITPTVSITASANNVCQGTTVIFTANAVAGGATVAYQWKLNGVNTGSNSTTFSSSTLANGDAISCVVTITGSCIAVPTATSNTINMTVNPTVNPSVSITASSNNVCAGTLVTFTATPVNGGASPVYQWQVNGVNAGTNSPTFGSSTLANGDKVTCILTGNAPCTAPGGVTSNSLTMVINPTLPASVSIAVSANNVCAGTNITFTATPVNGGAAPIYQWKINGVNAGTNSANFSSSTFADGDNVTCVMTSNALCALPVAATSNAVTMKINPYITPSVTITASSTNICQGEMVTFNAVAANGGAATTYQWMLNGNNAGTNSATFTSTTLVSGDAVSCRITISGTCITTPTALSNSIGITVNAIINPSVSIAASANNICAGTPVTFTATPVNGGTAPGYQWLVNGSNAGTNRNTFSSSTLANNDIVSCRLTNAAKCAVPATVTSNSITMVINPIPVVDGGGNKTIDKGTVIRLTATSSTGIGSVSWSPATGLDNTNTLTPNASPTSTTLYTVTVVSPNGCIGFDEVKITVLSKISVPGGFTPNADGVNDTWEIANLSDYPKAYVKIFNRWGSEVYHSRGYANAWDGTWHGKRLPFATYYYIINLGNNTPPVTGYVTLIR